MSENSKLTAQQQALVDQVLKNLEEGAGLWKQGWVVTGAPLSATTGNFVVYLFDEYSPYMIWVFLATAGVWSIAMGVAMIVAHKNDDKEKAKKMLVNYLIGLVVIFGILVQ